MKAETIIMDLMVHGWKKFSTRAKDGFGIITVLIPPEIELKPRQILESQDCIRIDDSKEEELLDTLKNAWNRHIPMPEDNESFRKFIMKKASFNLYDKKIFNLPEIELMSGLRIYVGCSSSHYSTDDSYECRVEKGIDLPEIPFDPAATDEEWDYYYYTPFSVLKQIIKNNGGIRRFIP